MIREIAPNVYVETEYHGANVAFVATGEGVILIDTPMLPREARHWLCEIQERTDEKILYIINTDHHRAHVIGNQHFPMATVVAHENAWKEMKSYGDSFRTRLMNMYRERIPEAAAEWKQTLEIVKPQVTFTGRSVLYKGKTELHLIGVGGHTPATTVIFMPNERLLFAGDVVVTNRPPFLSQGNTKEWLEALTLLRKEIRAFAREHQVLASPLDVYRVMELSRRIVLFFDKALYHTARGFAAERRGALP